MLTRERIRPDSGVGPRYSLRREFDKKVPLILETLTFTPQRGWSAELPRLDSENTAVFVFGSSSFLDAPGPIEALCAAFPSSQVLGCSTSGEIFQTTVSDDSIAAAIVRFERTRLRLACAPLENGHNSLQAGESIGNALRAPDLRGLFVLCDGLHVNGSDLVRGINGTVGPDVVITGGLAGDGSRFARTWVLHGEGLESKIVAALAFYGPHVRIGYGTRGGWGIFGPERRVTRAEGNELFELDGRPALSLYKEYLGDMSSELPSSALLFPLALRDKNSNKTVVRTVISIDEAKQSMTFAGDIPQGAFAQLMQATQDRLIEGAASAAKSVAPEVQGVPMLSLPISCVGRRLVLGERCDEELEAIMHEFEDCARQVGFYSYGEIAPGDTTVCDLHNQTMSVTTIAEG